MSPGSGVAALDVLVNGETVEAVGPHLSCPEAETVDVTGKLLFPGFIDAHTHFDLDVCNTTTADDFSTGTRAALRGGTTLVIDFACPNKGETLQYGLDLWHKKADGKSSCDYGFHMTIDDWNDGICREIPQMLEAGIPTFKMYMTYPAMMIGDRDLFLALEELRKYGAFAGVHCENAGVIDALIAQKKAAGEVSPASHPATRANALEGRGRGQPAPHGPGGRRAGDDRPPLHQGGAGGGARRPGPGTDRLCGDLPPVPAAGPELL